LTGTPVCAEIEPSEEETASRAAPSNARYRFILFLLDKPGHRARLGTQALSTAMIGWCLTIVVPRIATQDATPVHRYRADAATTTPGTRRKAASFREK
jgi:hypothetical protein